MVLIDTVNAMFVCPFLFSCVVYSFLFTESNVWAFAMIFRQKVLLYETAGSTCSRTG